MSEVNHEAFCTQCGHRVYHIDTPTILKKMCIECALALSQKQGGLDCYANEAAVMAAIHHHDRKN